MTVTFVTVIDSITNQAVEHAIIDRGNGEFTSMPKSIYDEQQSEISRHIVTE
jgi:hypothetical protein